MKASGHKIFYVSVREARHASAIAILASGRPFVFMLRTYRATPSWNRNLQNEFFDQFCKSVGFVSIRGDSALAEQEESDPDENLRARCPALSIGNNSLTGWINTARDLIAKAAHIVCEVWIDTPGVSLELELCRELGRIDDTVIILISPVYSSLRNLDTFPGYWRIILVQDLEELYAWEHPAVRGLRFIDELWTPPVAPSDEQDAIRRKAGVPFVISDFAEYADRCAKFGDLKCASIYASSAMAVATRLDEVGASLTAKEFDSLLHAFYIVARRHIELIEFDAAESMIDGGISMAQSDERFAAYIPRFDGLHGEIERVKKSIVSGEWFLQNHG